jgi:hypothetical protein
LAGCPELPVDPIQRARGRRIGNGRANTFASHHSAQTQLLHQPFDRAASHRDTLPVHMVPDFIRSVDPHIGLPDTLDFGPQAFIAYRTSAAARRIAMLCTPGPGSANTRHSRTCNQPPNVPVKQTFAFQRYGFDSAIGSSSR